MSLALGRVSICLHCQLRNFTQIFYRLNHATSLAEDQTPNSSIAPRSILDIRHIRKNPLLHEKNCIERNYKIQATYPEKICTLLEEWQLHQTGSQALRERSNQVTRELALSRTVKEETIDDIDLHQKKRDNLISEGRSLKERLSGIKARQAAITAETVSLALAMPNLTSSETPRGSEPKLVNYINNHPEVDPSLSNRVWRSHVEISQKLNLIDFSGAAITSGWGWYYLLDEAAQLEQALTQYATSVAKKRGWSIISPPSMIYTHMAHACGFQPRDQNGEQQVYHIQQSAADMNRKPQLSLAATAEIPLASMKANQTLEAANLPAKRVGTSRCYRAEAGARGVDTKGLYRVHEFTKVEMFAWTPPDNSVATAVFDEILSIQTEILTALGLHCRVLEMPSHDLGASATRKRDIEAFFPSRRARDGGWGEVTSVSICGDYQTRRLATRFRAQPGQNDSTLGFPYTINGTALAVPRVLAALLENGWSEEKGGVLVPEVLWPWMNGITFIGRN
ncbi:hypothetical protein K3495_g8885 [Podosphaera aphanis]|nr:hypothetical protein K3495_g8885 [Podosphaera aphanis]